MPVARAIWCGAFDSHSPAATVDCYPTTDGLNSSVLEPNSHRDFGHCCPPANCRLVCLGLQAFETTLRHDLEKTRGANVAPYRKLATNIKRQVVVPANAFESPDGYVDQFELDTSSWSTGARGDVKLLVAISPSVFGAAAPATTGGVLQDMEVFEEMQPILEWLWESKVDFVFWDCSSTLSNIVLDQLGPRAKSARAVFGEEACEEQFEDTSAPWLKVIETVAEKTGVRAAHILPVDTVGWVFSRGDDASAIVAPRLHAGLGQGMRATVAEGLLDVLQEIADATEGGATVKDSLQVRPLPFLVCVCVCVLSLPCLALCVCVCVCFHRLSCPPMRGSKPVWAKVMQVSKPA